MGNTATPKPNSTETVAELPIVKRLRNDAVSQNRTHGADPLCTEAAALITELCDALKPFAGAYENEGDGDKHEDQHNLWEHPAAIDITVGDLRRALHVLAKAHPSPKDIPHDQTQ